MVHFQEDFCLKNYNTFGIAVQVKNIVFIHKENDLQSVQEALKTNNLLILGGGSNLLFTKNFEGLIAKINIKGIEIIEENDHYIYVKAGAGEVWNDFVKHCVENNWGGVENLTLIPGTVGAAPVQNIGAYGVELKDVMESCTAYEIESGTIKNFHHSECKFSYRESIFKQEAKGKYIITSVVFKLTKHPILNTSYGAIKDELERAGIINANINDISKIVAKIRVSKLPDPSTIGNAGSFFKNPIITKQQLQNLQAKYPDVINYPITNDDIKLAAGWLIEQCGWKGKIIGNTGTWKNQALVIVNHGEASGGEIWAFAQEIIQSVERKFGVKLSPEVNVF